MERQSLLLGVSVAVIVSAGVTIAAHYLRPPRAVLIYVFKPLTTTLILVAALLPATLLIDPYAGAIALGLLFSLGGDILLMLPGDRFLPGLISFLLAHICYAFAFFTAARADGLLWPALLLAIVGATILRYLWPSLPAGLRGAVSLYVAVIVTMAALAGGRAISHFSTGTLSAASGALLFLTSDLILAVDRFRRPIHLASAAVLMSYFTGQLLIALSIGLQEYRGT